jgi:hypothetical protein
MSRCLYSWLLATSLCCFCCSHDKMMGQQHAPDMASAPAAHGDMAMPEQQGGGADLSQPQQQGVPDMAMMTTTPMPDLAPPFVPTPTPVWLSGMGGSLSATTGAQLNLSAGSAVLVGEEMATSGAVIIGGYLGADTIQ